jgi:excinuclease UvrABC nuclease subunit
MFLDKCNNPLYIGKSKNLKLRLYDHTKGFSKSTKDHINDFEKCSLFFVSSKHDTDLWLEALMIEEFKPPLNKMISKWRVENIKHYALLNKLFPLG